MSWLASRRPAPTLIRILLLSFAGWFVIQTASSQPASLEDEFPKTDFSNSVVDFDEIQSGGPPRDGIPALDDPRFISADRADWLHPDEPVIVVTVDDQSRAYPLQIMIWHEIVNDTIAGKPLAVTFCPLCNATLVFEREFDGRVLDFGTTGRLRKSDLLMYDRQTETWWQQFTGKGLIGEYAGRHLVEHPASIVAFEAFSDQHPEGPVLSRRTGHNRAYGDNPYRGYDRVDQSPFLFEGKTDSRLPPMERVLAVRVGERFRAYPFGEFREPTVLNEKFAGRPIAVFAAGEALSALDKRSIKASRRVPSLNAFDRQLSDKVLEFEMRDGEIFDVQTGSQWNSLGTAMSGPLEGQRLDPMPGGIHFAFAWLAFRPDTSLYGQY